jgi:hypothetical protein
MLLVIKGESDEHSSPGFLFGQYFSCSFSGVVEKYSTEF